MSIDPDKKGVASAWLMPYTKESNKQHVEEWGYEHTGIRTWFVHGPYHPFWNWWLVSIISLKDIEGIPKANKMYPEAENEFTIYSLEGEVNIEAIIVGDLKNRGFKSVLQPADVTFHYHGLTTEQSEQLCDTAVEVIVNGQSCDSDFRTWWLEMLARTVKHYQEGLH